LRRSQEGKNEPALGNPKEEVEGLENCFLDGSNVCHHLALGDHAIWFVRSEGLIYLSLY
jgi:hypothetical protein